MAKNDAVSKLFLKLQELIKKPGINMALNDALDSFIGVLKEKDDYLKNGIVNVDFPEAALFVELAASALGKEVDILWEDIVQFHMHLCEQNKTPENVAETKRIQERIKKGKRKKIELPTNEISQNLNQNVITLLNSATQVLKKVDNLNNSNQLNNSWKIANLLQKDVSNTVPRTSRDAKIPPTSEFRLPLSEAVMEIDTNEKLTNYNNLFCTGLLNLEVESEVPGKKNSNCDDILQKYLNAKQLTYENFFLHKCGNDFELFKNMCESVEDAVTVLPPEGLCSPNVTECIDSLIVSIVPQKHSKAASECVSEVDSLFHEVQLSENDFSNTRASQTRQSMTDSGFCTDGNISDGTHIEEDLPNNGSVIKSLTLQECTTPSVESSCGHYVAQVAQESVTTVVQGSVITAEGDLLGFINEKELEKRSPRKRKLKLSEEYDYGDVAGEVDELPKKRQLRKPTFRLLKRLRCYDHEIFERFYIINFINEEEENDDEVCDESFQCIRDELHSTPKAGIRFRNSSDDSGFPLTPLTEHDSSVHSDLVDALPTLTPLPEIVETSSEPSITETPHTTETPSRPTVESRLAVNKWSQFIQPKLDEVENSLNFDIHKYGAKIMDTVPENQPLHFKDLVMGKSAAEVSRMFLTTLQLASSNNVEIIRPDVCELANDTMQIKLVTRDRYQEQLENYAAPSTRTYRERLENVKASRSSTSQEGVGRSCAKSVAKIRKRIFP